MKKFNLQRRRRSSIENISHASATQECESDIGRKIRRHKEKNTNRGARKRITI